MARCGGDGAVRVRQFIARIDEGYFYENEQEGATPSHTSIELAIDRMNHWLAANADADVRIRVELVEKFEDRQIYRVLDDIGRLERMGVFDQGYADVFGAVQFAWEYALETWPVDGHVEVRP